MLKIESRPELDNPIQGGDMVRGEYRFNGWPWAGFAAAIVIFVLGVVTGIAI